MVDPAAVAPGLTAALDALPARAVRGGTAVESSIRVRGLAVLARRVEAAFLAEVAAFDDQGFAAACGSRSTGAFLAAHTHLDSAAAARTVLAARTADRLPQLGAMLSAGQIGVEHVAAVGYATRRLPQQVVTDQDATFAALAVTARPSELRVAGVHLQTVYDADAVTKNANHLRESRYLSLSQTFEDAWHLEGQLTPADGAALAVALEALMTPGGEEDTRTVTQRRADALVELAELGLRSAELPDCGGDRPRVTLLVQAGDNPFAHLLEDDDDAPDRSSDRDRQRRGSAGGPSCAAGCTTSTGAATGTGRPAPAPGRCRWRSPGSTSPTCSCSPAPG